jgi:hypothetical protein
MKMTLLDIVQDILNDMDGDEVNTIDDTIESAQVAQIIKSTYYAIISNRNWPHTRQAIQIQPSGDSALPTHMIIQEEIKELSFINYNKVKLGETRRLYKPITWLEPDDFLRVVNRRDNDASNIDVITDPTGVELLIKSDLAPTYYTSFDDTNLVFDSYDNEVDTTLQQSKIQAQAYVIPSWSPVDDFIPDLPAEAFTALLEESKSRAMLKLKQVTDVKAEQESSRQQRWLSRKAWRAHGGIKFANYGRKTNKYKDVTFRDGDR